MILIMPFSVMDWINPVEHIFVFQQRNGNVLNVKVICCADMWWLIYKKSPFRYNRVVQAAIKESDVMAKQTNSLVHTKWTCRYHIVFGKKWHLQHENFVETPFTLQRENWPKNRDVQGKVSSRKPHRQSLGKALPNKTPMGQNERRSEFGHCGRTLRYATHALTLYYRRIFLWLTGKNHCRCHIVSNDKANLKKYIWHFWGNTEIILILFAVSSTIYK